MWLSALVLTGCLADGNEAFAPTEEPLELESATQALKTGSLVPDGQFEAVGRMSCTGTMIHHQVVLTAAHCVCPSDSSPVGCDTRRDFMLTNVRPVDDPSTTTDESATRRNVVFSGDVSVHPDFGRDGWLRKDYAVIVLDEPIYKRVVDVVPMPVADSSRQPTVDDALRLIGFGPLGQNCDAQPYGTKRNVVLEPSSVVTEAIRFSPNPLCGGDSGGPVLDETNVFVLGVASMYAGNTGTYRPAYEVYDWIDAFVKDATEARGSDHFWAAEGTSSDMDHYQDRYGYWPAVGIIAMDIASNNAVYTWYNNGTVTKGLSWALDNSVPNPYPFSLPPGKTVSDIVEIAIASDDIVYAFYKDGTVSKGHTFDLDAVQAPYAYTLPPGKTPADIVGISIAKSTDHVYAWYRDGKASSGRSWDLDAIRAPYTFTAATGHSPEDLVGVGIAANDHVYSWYRYDGPVTPQ
jgi:hypothetical protein